jgi:hypothetical protein
MLAATYQNLVPTLVVVGLVSVLVKFLLPICLREIKLSRIPLADKRPGEWFDTKSKQRMVQNYRQILKDGLEKVKSPNLCA